MATSREGYSSHCSLIERQKALVAVWDIYNRKSRDSIQVRDPQVKQTEKSQCSNRSCCVCACGYQSIKGFMNNSRAPLAKRLQLANKTGISRKPFPTQRDVDSKMLLSSTDERLIFATSCFFSSSTGFASRV